MKARGLEKAQGFSLIELMIVCAIISILAAIAIPGLLSSLDKSKQVSTLALLRSYSSALEIYNADNITYPVTTDMNQLVEVLKPFSETLRTDDEWGHSLHYEVTTGADYTIRSYGKDGIPGAYVTPQTRYVFELDLGVSNGQITGGVE